jgi:hypothetical protein
MCEYPESQRRRGRGFLSCTLPLPQDEIRTSSGI